MKSSLVVVAEELLEASTCPVTPYESARQPVLLRPAGRVRAPCAMSFALCGQDTPKPDARRQAMGDRAICQPGRPFVSPTLLRPLTASGAMIDRHEWDAKAFVNLYAILLTTCWSAFQPYVGGPSGCRGPKSAPRPAGGHPVPS